MIYLTKEDRKSVCVGGVTGREESQPPSPVRAFFGTLFARAKKVRPLARSEAK